MNSRIHFVTLPALVACSFHSYATAYHTIESAQRACFPDATEFVDASVKLSKDQIRAIEKETGIRVHHDTQRVWRANKNKVFAGWFLVDDVLGKHELITYALALKPDGTVQSIEIMKYRETYGYEIRNADWRTQFIGKKPGAALKLDDDIRNISGATLSCRHVTDGVKRLLAFYEVALKQP
jgi:Na+-translocating ferredoxin:NAD+ oxidoreductase RnfG subunit